MNILSLETSTKNLSLAVSKNDKVLRFRNTRNAKLLESSIITSIDQLVLSAGLKFKEIDILAIGLGPGSFTSLRVGLSTIKAFALASNQKVIGICSLDVIAAGVVELHHDEVCVIVDARRGNVYAAIFDRTLNCTSGYLLTKIDEVLTRVKGNTLFVGDGLILYKDAIEASYRTFSKEKASFCKATFAAEKFWYPQAKVLAKLAHRKLEQQKFDDPAKLAPIYLYPEDCQVDRK